METIFRLINKISDFIVELFAWESAIFDLIVISFFCAFFLLFLFKKLSNQEKIKFHRNKIFGYILEIGVFRDHFGRIISNQVKILKHNLIYLRYVIQPFLLMMIPVIIVFIQIENRLGYLPIQKNTSFIIQAALDREVVKDIDSLISKVYCQTSTGIILETPPLRIASEGIVFWRARLKVTGPQFVRLGIDGTQKEVKKKIVTLTGHERFCPTRSKADSLSYLLNSAETPIPRDSYFKFVSVNYSPATYPFFFWDISPIIYFFILSLGFGLILKPFIKVNI